MKVQTFYRLSVWVPLALPLPFAVLVWVRGFSTIPAPLRPLLGALFGTLVYGGIPYLVLALWATWRISRLNEPEIKRLMVKAPFLMIGVFTLFWFLAGARVGRPEFGLLGPLAAVIIVPVAFGYMGLVLLIREELGDRLSGTE